MKLHELTREAVGLEPIKPEPPKIKFVPPDPNNPTKEQVLMALKSAYRQLMSANSAVNNKGIASRFIAPAIIFVESQL